MTKPEAERALLMFRMYGERDTLIAILEYLIERAVVPFAEPPKEGGDT